ncbi:MAG: two-component system sensor histidine kinase NtrB, partial [Planctomycetota bacterium]
AARKHWSTAARALVDELETPGGEVASRMESCVRRVDELSLATGELIRIVRRDLRSRSVNLEEHWSYLFRLAAGLFAAVAILTWLLARSKKHAKEQAAAKNALQEGESRLRALLKVPQGLMWSIDQSGCWSYLSDAARAIYGHPPEEMIGRPVAEFVPGDRVAEERDFFARVLRSDGPVQGESIHLRADGERVTLFLEARVMRDEGGRAIGTTGFATDVTAIHSVRRRQLHGERLQAIGTLAGGVAHDFNNLLGVIQCSCDVARESLTDDPKEASESLHDLALATDRARQLTAQLLAFARRQSLQRTSWDLVELVRRTRAFLARLMDGGISLQCLLPDEEVTVRADRNQVEQVIVNLVMNSRDAVSGGGTITITVRRARLKAAEAAPLEIPAGEWALLEVRDDGEGMAEETQRRAFEPFFTTKEQGEGTGLGLASAHGIILDHGGAIRLESAPGVGTLVQIALPLAMSDEEEGADGAPIDAIGVVPSE